MDGLDWLDLNRPILGFDLFDLQSAIMEPFCHSHLSKHGRINDLRARLTKIVAFLTRSTTRFGWHRFSQIATTGAPDMPAPGGTVGVATDFGFRRLN
jgi:hypothetical protein